MNKHIRNFLASIGFVESQDEIEWQKWYEEQLHKLETDEEIKPPWVTFPNSEPYGWNQGYQEAWKVNVWLPFWQALNAKQREIYLERWQPPTEEWLEYIAVHWISK